MFKMFKLTTVLWACWLFGCGPSLTLAFPARALPPGGPPSPYGGLGVVVGVFLLALIIIVLFSAVSGGEGSAELVPDGQQRFDCGHFGASWDDHARCPSCRIKEGSCFGREEPCTTCSSWGEDKWLLMARTRTFRSRRNKSVETPTGTGTAPSGHSKPVSRDKARSKSEGAKGSRSSAGQSASRKGASTAVDDRVTGQSTLPSGEATLTGAGTTGHRSPGDRSAGDRSPGHQSPVQAVLPSGLPLTGADQALTGLAESSLGSDSQTGQNVDYSKQTGNRSLTGQSTSIRKNVYASSAKAAATVDTSNTGRVSDLSISVPAPSGSYGTLLDISQYQHGFPPVAPAMANTGNSARRSNTSEKADSSDSDSSSTSSSSSQRRKRKKSKRKRRHQAARKSARHASSSRERRHDQPQSGALAPPSIAQVAPSVTGFEQGTPAGFMPWLLSMFQLNNQSSIPHAPAVRTEKSPAHVNVRGSNALHVPLVERPPVDHQSSRLPSSPVVSASQSESSDSEKYEQEVDTDSDDSQAASTSMSHQSTLSVAPAGLEQPTALDIMYRHGAGESRVTPAPPLARCLQSFKPALTPGTQVLSQSSVLRDTWAGLDAALYGGIRPADFSISLPENNRKQVYFTASDPPLAGFRRSAYTLTTGVVPQTTEVIDQDLSLLGFDVKPPTVNIPSRAFAETQSLLKSAQNVASFVDHALHAAIEEGRLAEESLADREESNIPRSALNDQSTVLQSVAKGLSHMVPLIARASANLLLQQRSAVLSSSKASLPIPAVVKNALQHAPLGDPRVFAGQVADARAQADKLTSAALTVQQQAQTVKQGKKKATGAHTKKPAPSSTTAQTQNPSSGSKSFRKKSKSKKKGKAKATASGGKSSGKRA